jgi:hypothetical protein
MPGISRKDFAPGIEPVGVGESTNTVVQSLWSNP